ncbi:MAG: 2-C-methyl-D-erythritol 4-phosphate cytidylyltransferase [Ideonella sp.]|nr:2-C-methyl-D-erythritol 4-phosphate cytidylyltransferase [Ideonella sp.]
MTAERPSAPAPVPLPPGVRCFALVPCAGFGARAGSVVPKQYVPVAGRPMVVHTLKALAQVERLSGILVALAPGDDLFGPAWEQGAGPSRHRVWTAHCGGETRAATVTAGLAVLAERGAGDDDWVLVHDAARCLLRPEWVDHLIDACGRDAVGGLLALPLADTLKAAAGAGDPAAGQAGPRVAATVDRAGKWLAQTPQMFRLGMLREALATAGTAVTDESSALEAMGFAPRLVEGAYENLKVTYPADFALAERLMRSR